MIDSETHHLFSSVPDSVLTIISAQPLETLKLVETSISSSNWRYRFRLFLLFNMYLRAAIASKVLGFHDSLPKLRQF